MKKHFLFLSLAAIAFSACTIEDPKPEPGKVMVEPVITRALSLNFNEGNKIGLDVIMADGSKYATNAGLTYSGSAFSGDLKWYAEGGEACTLNAYFPYQEAGFPSVFSVAADQSNGTESSDLMFATKSGVYPNSNPELMVFRHQLVQIVISLDNSAGAEVEGVTLRGLIPTANVSLEGGAVVDASASAQDIKAEEVVANQKFCAVVVPQSFAELGLVLDVKDAASIITSIDESELRPGYSYNVSVSVSADKVTTTIGGEIEEWADGGNLSGKDEPQEPSFEEFDGYFVYDGLRYNTVKLSNGSTWMAEPLAYLPKGKTVSDDPAAGGIWYPYSSDGTNITVLKDAESIKANGYLYDIENTLCVTLTEENFLDFEGVQGICPKGWHVPTRAEWFALCGVSNALARLGESGTQTDDTALFYDKNLGYAPISAYNEAGFNFVLSGSIGNNKYSNLIIDSSVCDVEEYFGKNRMAYVASSTANSYRTTSGTVSPTYMALMTTFTSANAKGKTSVAAAKVGAVGAQVRCTKDTK
ncbi:MAG: fimbrillin family protein [Bacteroidales bacterium]|nr:fimbrillin family protein [Bacteroidales bacterium]